ncbi:oligosaccharide repeat unit polymerase [Alkalihalobacillus rhizosphaerae]|nr:oligosaccharide repeat unit polymerase [Shouchella rhizosphaerae]
MIGLYTLKWSSLYPSLQISLVFFILITSTICIFLSKIYNDKVRYSDIEVRSNKLGYAVGVLLVAHCIEFMYFGRIPLFSLASNAYFDFEDYSGIPFLHVFIVSFNIFLSTYIFHAYISSKNKQTLVFFILTLIPPVLIVSRGLSIMIVISCTFLYLTQHRKVITKKIPLIILVGVCLLYLFGLFGNVRLSNQVNLDSNYNDASLIMLMGGATEEFRDSLIPDSFFWGYLYITSPLANLQNTVQDEPEIDLLSFFSNNILYDFLGNRMSEAYDIDDPNVNLIHHNLTVGTFFMRAYPGLGWLGLILMFLHYLFIVSFYVFILGKSKQYFFTGISILSAIILFNGFSNMFVFSGFSLAIIYPVLLYAFNRLRKNMQLSR